MVGWWYDKNPLHRVRENVAKQQRNELLDELAKRILKSEAERQRKWMKQLVMTSTTLAFRLDDLHLDRKRIDAWYAKTLVACELLVLYAGLKAMSHTWVI